MCTSTSSNIYAATPPVEGIFSDASSHGVKPHACIWFVDKLDRIVNNYRIALRIWKWTKKLFFHFTDIAILTAFLIHKSHGGKMTYYFPGGSHFVIWSSIGVKELWQLVEYPGSKSHQSEWEVKHP
jgi:hypothetical protein